MKHGLPLPPPPSSYVLNLGHWKKGGHCGCPKLVISIKHTQPQLYCFSHIHEGHKAEMTTWHEDADQSNEKFEILNKGDQIDFGKQLRKGKHS